MKVNYKLPDMDHRFSIQVTGKESNINWAGEFVYRRPTLATRSRIEALRARLNGDLQTITPDISDLNFALSHLRFTLTEYPEWWSASDFGGGLYDSNVIIEIFKKCMDFEESWRKKVHGGDPKDVMKTGEVMDGEPAYRVAEGP